MGKELAGIASSIQTRDSATGREMAPGGGQSEKETAHRDAPRVDLRLNVGRDLVELSGIEPLAFPARRDALRGGLMH